MNRSFTFWVLILLCVSPFISLKSQVVINEYSVSNLSQFLDNYQKYEDWIELYNSGGTSEILSGYYLSDNPNNPTKWQIPAGITLPAGGFIRFWASGRDEAIGNHYHTNFRLTQTKTNPESVVLSNSAGVVIDQHPLQNTQLGHSRGRQPNGSSTWMIFTNPTPGSSNNNASSHNAYAALPVMSHTAGVFPSGIAVSISSAEPTAEIRYTLDGTEPTQSSSLYTQAINITTTKVLKAKTYSLVSGVLPSLVVFHTYFINVNHSLPVVSVAADQLHALLNGNQTLEPKGSFEFFDTNGVRTTYTYGEFNKHGQDSWVHPQRSIDYISRDECGIGHTIRHKFFNTSDRDEFQRVILRASGDDNYPGKDSSAHIRDVFIQNLAAESGMQLDIRRGRRCVVYANGNYWGIYAIREKVSDHDYTDFYYGQGKYDIQFVMTWGNTWAEYGGQQAINDWNSFKNFVMNNNMDLQSNYDYVLSQYDITSLVDYIILNSFVVCSDWLNWNVGIWRGFNPNGTHHRWGYILWDEDATFGHYINYTGIPSQSPTVSPCFPEQLTNSWQDPEYHIRILNKLKDNVDFNQYYISRYIDLLNTSLSLSHLLDKFDSSVAIITGEMPQHITRWGGNINQWQNNVQKVRNFIITRSSIIGDGLKTCYNLTGPYSLTIVTDPPDYGQVQVNSHLIDQYPWQGQYYGNVAVRCKSVPANSSYEIDYWTVNNHFIWPHDSAVEIILNLTSDDTVVAHFKQVNLMDSVIINEINYKSANWFNTKDWVELFNPMPYTLDVSSWLFKDENDNHIFTFPQGTLITSHGYLVICEDTSALRSFFPNVNPIIGNTGFGLSSNGELLRIYNAQGILIDHVTYGTQPPWPTTPNGTGLTLELISPLLDNTYPQSWMASNVTGGTPGAMNSYTVGEAGQEKGNDIEIVIYPNPIQQAATFLFISSAEIRHATFTMYDMMGKEVFSIHDIHSHHIRFQRGSLAPGVYLCRLENGIGQSSTIHKIVVH